jgi:hypothetical protein
VQNRSVVLNNDSGVAAGSRVDSASATSAAVGSTSSSGRRSEDLLDGPVALGAAIATFGLDGAVIYSQRRSLLRMTDAVTAGTWWGAVKVIAWDFGGLWLLISLGIMLPVAIWIPKHRSSRRIT